MAWLSWKKLKSWGEPKSSGKTLTLSDQYFGLGPPPLELAKTFEFPNLIRGIAAHLERVWSLVKWASIRRMERLGGREGFSLSQAIDYVAFSQTVALEMERSNQTHQWQPC